MEQFKVGDIVARKSYNMDVLFKIVYIRDGIADLAGLTVRISADAFFSDLVHIPEHEIKARMNRFESMKSDRISRCYTNVQRRFNVRNENYMNPTIYTKEKLMKKPGVILHIDGEFFYEYSK